MVLWRTARVHPADPRQVASHKPTCTTSDEFAQYVWDVRQDGWNRDQPLKERDDGMDCCEVCGDGSSDERRVCHDEVEALK